MSVSEERSKTAAGPLSLEAEAAAWRSKRCVKPATVVGKVAVVRIRRRLRPSSWSGASAGHPLAVERR